MPHQAVKIEGRGGPGVGLNVLHFGNALEAFGQGRRDFRRSLERRSFGRVHDQLQFVLVVEREHLHQDFFRRHQGRRAAHQNEDEKKKADA